jgi:hypothetical protein
MKWYKHQTDSHNDETLAEVLHEFGLEGYGFWWLLQEIVGKSMDASDRCDLSYPLATWARKLQSSKRKTSTFFQKFSEIFLIILDFDEGNENSSIGKLKISIPNLLKSRDEYSKKSGQSPDKKEKVSGAKIEIQIHKKNKPVVSPEVVSFFDQLWNVYPRKIGKPEALKHYLKTVKTDDDINRINLALANYLDNVKDTEMKYIKHGSAWFNTWQNWEVSDAD